VSEPLVYLNGRMIPASQAHLAIYDAGLVRGATVTEMTRTFTPYCLMPVTKVNGVRIGDGRPGPLFRRLLTAWGAEVGLDIEKQIREGARQRQGRE
jgi:branched-chain amino acid aminotransferase